MASSGQACAESRIGKVGGIEQSGRLEVGGDLHDLVVVPRLKVRYQAIFPAQGELLSQAANPRVTP
jgi:hypothetical protein